MPLFRKKQPEIGPDDMAPPPAAAIIEALAAENAVPVAAVNEIRSEGLRALVEVGPPTTRLGGGPITMIDLFSYALEYEMGQAIAEQRPMSMDFSTNAVYLFIKDHSPSLQYKLPELLAEILRLTPGTPKPPRSIASSLLRGR